MSKHRPGPWILSETSILRHGDTTPTQICEIFCNRNNKLIAEIPDYCFHAEDLEQDMADARLIAAAPELLSIAQRFVALDDQWHPDRHAAEKAELMAEARAVIAKAQGDS